jgi:plasmid stability protein
LAKQLTIRGISDELNRRLARLGREKGQSVNVLARSILERAVGIDARKERLRRYATWGIDEQQAFEKALGDQRVIDDELWR